MWSDCDYYIISECHVKVTVLVFVNTNYYEVLNVVRSRRFNAVLNCIFTKFFMFTLCKSRLFAMIKTSSEIGRNKS